MSSFNGPLPGSTPEQFASLLVSHAEETAAHCMEHFSVKENYDRPEDAPNTYELLLTIYLALVLVILEHYGMSKYQDFVLKQTKRRFAGGITKWMMAKKFVGNIFEAVRMIHPQGTSIPFDELKEGWHGRVREILDSYNEARFAGPGPRSFLVLINPRETSEYLIKHAKSVESHCMSSSA